MANLIHLIKTSVRTVDSNSRTRNWLLETSIIPSTPSPPGTSNKGNNQTCNEENTKQCSTNSGGYRNNSKSTQWGC